MIRISVVQTAGWKGRPEIVLHELNPLYFTDEQKIKNKNKWINKKNNKKNKQIMKKKNLSRPVVSK